MPIIMQCHECEIKYKCVNKPQLECVDYGHFSSEKKDIPQLTNEMKEEYAEKGVTFNERGQMELTEDFSMNECHFCHRVDHTLVYQRLGKNIFCCNECKSKMVADDDTKTMELIDMLCGAEEFARKENVNKGIESIVCVLVDSIRKGLVGDSTPLLNLYNTIQAVGSKESIRDAIKSNVFNKKELGYMKRDIEEYENQLGYDETLKLSDETEEE